MFATSHGFESCCLDGHGPQPKALKLETNGMLELQPPDVWVFQKNARGMGHRSLVVFPGLGGDRKREGVNPHPFNTLMMIL